MKKLALAAAASASALVFSAQASFADYTLNIIHINDWHSRIESNNKYESTCSAEDEGEGKCFGGAARLVTAVRDYRASHEGENVLFLNAGDNFQGSLFFTTYHGAAEAEFLNIMKPDAVTLGNHEFDEGEDTLAAFFDTAEFPVISAARSLRSPMSDIPATWRPSPGSRASTWLSAATRTRFCPTPKTEQPAHTRHGSRIRWATRSRSFRRSPIRNIWAT
jgi:hypothetical protein